MATTFDDVDDEWPPRADDGGDIDDVWPTHNLGRLTMLMKIAQRPTASKRHNSVERRKQLSQNGHVAHAATIEVHVRRAVPLAAGFDASSLPAASGAYSAKVENKSERYGSKVRRSLTNLLGLGFQLVTWDGITPHPLLDKHGRIIAILAGRPDCDDYLASATAAFNTIRNAGLEVRFPATMRKHCRGLFAAINVGLSYGKGQKTPCWLSNKEYSTLTDGLLAILEIQRLTNFADAVFGLWAPRLYSYYREHDSELRRNHPHLRHPFVGSIFSCAAFNFGPNVWTFRHRDVLNLVFGWCAVQALGRFNATKGGHLVLWA
ncbi:hypothetical protein B0H14DRAFT_3525961 [Mycena olivaceomarginata]|nr:hypothetical protein B0H14DRAFT_3525961 [Mycena olivaceomarginata]